MVHSAVLLVAFASNLAVTVLGAAFLQAQEGGSHEVSKEEVETVFLEYFTGSHNRDRISQVEQELQPMYLALPKNQFGTLQPTTVRYAVHRYFVHKYGWYMKGLDPAGSGVNTSVSGTIMKDRAPSHVQALFEQRVHGHGLGLRDIAVFAVALADLIHKEAWLDVYKIYSSMQLSTADRLPRKSINRVVRAYLAHYIMETDMSHSTPTILNMMEAELPEIYPAWSTTDMWAADFRQWHDFERSFKQNPFVESARGDSFDETVEYVQEFGHSFGQYQRLECTTLKRQLVDMEYQGTGRVLLSRFYGGGLNGDWTFSESTEYLRNLGVLDEANPSRPSVMIPNYLSSSTNCLTGSGFYSVCCSDECEGLFHHLERRLISPRASPSDIAALISNLPSDTVYAPRNLSSTLTGRLNEIAQRHDGSVPLHGRLFAQWMHHAYPRECPFPHISGTISPMNPTEWSAVKGDVEATMEEMQDHHRRLEADETASLDLPWHVAEELVAEQYLESSWTLLSVRSLMLLLVMASFAKPAFHALSALQCTSDGNAGKAVATFV